MFREMRRKGQQLCEADYAAVLDQGTSGMLALEGGDGPLCGAGQLSVPLPI